MVEFALASVVIFGVIGLVFDFGVGLRNYNLLAHTTATVARDFAATRYTAELPEQCAGQVDATTCGGLAQCAGILAENHLREELGVSGSYRFRASFNNPASSPSGRWLVRLRGDWPLDCFFCLLFPRGITISNQSDSVIESNLFSCNQVGGILEPS